MIIDIKKEYFLYIDGNDYKTYFLYIYYSFFFEKI